MADAEVKARLTIEQDGEPQALRDAADAVGDLGTAAGTTAPNLEALKTAAEGLQSSLQSVAAGLQAIDTAGSTAFASILAQLDQVIAKANAAATAVSQLTNKS
jgi:hypothetical protein